MTKIEIRYRGPYRVIGEIELIDPDGNVIPTEGETWLCRCGNTGNAPFCDGAHKCAYKKNRDGDEDERYPPSRSNR